MYATPWHVTDRAGQGELPDYLWLSRFERYYRLSADQLPHVLSREVLDTTALTFRRWQHAGTVTGARLWLFCLPSGQIVAALSIDTSSDLINTIDLLEDCYFGDVQIGQMSAEAYAHALATQLGAAAVDGPDHRFLPERHQIVFGQAPAPEDCEDLIQRLIYRTDLPYLKE